MDREDKVDYPAAHSMDTAWFAIDDEGEVACLNTGETGPLPEQLAPYGISCFELFHHLPTDQYGIRLLPIAYDPFADGQTTDGIENILARLPEKDLAAIRKLALQTNLSAEEERQIKESIRLTLSPSLVWLVDPADAPCLLGPPDKFSPPFLIRLSAAKPVYHVFGASIELMCLLIRGRLLASRPADDINNRGVASVYGIHVFEEDSRSSKYNYRDGCLFPPRAPLGYRRVGIPKYPLVGLPATTMTANIAISDNNRSFFFPLILRLPGVRFSETEWIQIADFVPCYDWDRGSFVPTSPDLVVRRYMDIAHAPASPERDRHIANWVQATEQGDRIAAYSLGYLYYQGPSPDFEQASLWFRRAAELAETSPSDTQNIFENGSAAQCYLAELFERGVGVPQDYCQAFHWYMNAARKEIPVAAYRLGLMYQAGRGVQKDMLQACAWLAMSADKGYWPDRGIQWEKLDSADAEQGDTEAQFKQGAMHDAGVPGVLLRDEKQALHWYERAAAQGHAEAQYRAGLMHLLGEGVSANPLRAFARLARAAAQGHEKAQWELRSLMHWIAGKMSFRLAGRLENLATLFDAASQCFADGNYPLAAYWYRKVADCADASLPTSQDILKIASDAQAILGMCAENRWIRPWGDKQAHFWYSQSAVKGNNPVAQWRLGRLYMKASSDMKDPAKARYWLQMSAEHGDERAQLALLKLAKTQP